MKIAFITISTVGNCTENRNKLLFLLFLFPEKAKQNVNRLLEVQKQSFKLTHFPVTQHQLQANVKLFTPDGQGRS